MLNRQCVASLVSVFATVCSLLTTPILVQASEEIQSIALDRVVGDGTPDSCTQAELEAKLSAATPGETVSFNCGVMPFVLNLTRPITLTRDVTLEGGNTVVLSTGGQGRCLNVPAGVTANMRNLTFQRCGLDAQQLPSFSGGAIHNEGSLTVDHTQFIENRADYGGAIDNLAGGRLDVVHSSFGNNDARFEAGAIRNTLSATALITSSTFSQNYYSIENLGVMQITDTLILSSSGRDGAAGIGNAGILTLTYSHVISSSGAAVSAGLYNFVGGSMLVLGSRIDGNRAERMGGGIINNGTLVLDSSSVSGNFVQGRFSGFGGGMINGGEATVTNSTFSDNHNFVSNSGYGGGGILNTGHVTITASTLTSNGPYGVDTIFGSVSSVTTATVKQTIVASNTTDFRGALQSQGYNVVGIVPVDSVFLTSTGDQVGNPLAPIDAQLGPLADNGGRTRTHALLSVSPAIDAIPVSACAVVIDQRGVARPQGQACDIGAFEAVVTGGTALVLDPFNRPNGPLLGHWTGPEGLGGYQILGGRVDVLGGGPIYWSAARYGQSQQARITLISIDPMQREHSVLLKVQGDPPNWRKGYIQVVYFGATKAVQVSTYQPEWRWVDYALMPLPMQAGDRLSGQALADGRVRIFKNDHLAFTVKLIARDQAFFNPVGGRIGMWFNGYGAPMSAWLDDFGGGSVLETATSASTSNGAEMPDVPLVTDYTERDQPRDGFGSEHYFLPVVLD